SSADDSLSRLRERARVRARAAATFAYHTGAAKMPSPCPLPQAGEGSKMVKSIRRLLPALVRIDELRGRRFLRPDGEVVLALELDEVGRRLGVLAGRVELDALVAHHQLLGLEIGLLQRLLDRLGCRRAGTVDGVGENEERLHVARRRIVHHVAGLGLEQLVDLGRRAARLAGIPGAAVDDALRDGADILDEGG